MKKLLSSDNKFYQILITVAMLASFALVVSGGFTLLQNRNIQNNLPKALLALIAIVWGVGSLLLLFYSLNNVIIQFPLQIQKKLEPIMFVGPATLLLCWYLLFPTIRSLILSVMNNKGESFVGLENFKYIFTNETMLISFRNNLIWLVLGTGLCVVLGLVAAIATDRVRYSKIAGSILFMPLAVSFVGAGVIWRFVYAYRTEGAQVGVLNAILGAFGQDPINWLLWTPWNSIFLIVIFVWIQTGFAMVILSAAIKGVPIEMIEAARIDGVSEFNIILHIIIPSIKGTIITISTTILILTLKIFDIVYSITNGLYGTEVLASQQFKFMFKFLHYGRGSAISIVIFILVIPVMIYNLVQLNKKGLN